MMAKCVKREGDTYLPINHRQIGLSHDLCITYRTVLEVQVIRFEVVCTKFI